MGCYCKVLPKSGFLNKSFDYTREEMSREEQMWKKGGEYRRAGVIHKLGGMLGGSCLIHGGNEELTPLIHGDKFQMCLNVVRPTALSALTSVLTTPITALRIGGRCTNEACCVAMLSIMQKLQCFLLQSMSLITQFAPQIPALPSWRLQPVKCGSSLSAQTSSLWHLSSRTQCHKRKCYFKPHMLSLMPFLSFLVIFRQFFCAFETLTAGV